MNIVLITTDKRPAILTQSIESMITNAVDWERHTLTTVVDGWQLNPEAGAVLSDYSQLGIMTRGVGASRSRNIGASSIPKYLRQSHVMFVDDDVYACPRWDEQLESVIPDYFAIVSGHAHPYNHTVLVDEPACIHTNVISTVHMVMPWELWDKIGWFAEPGGPGGSEDVDYCKRTVDRGHSLVITKPHCIIHTGITSSSGKPIVGAEMVM